MNATVTAINDKAKAAGSSTLDALKRAAQSETTHMFVQAAAVGAGVTLGIAIVSAGYKAITS